jgi:hypothetical protein
MSRHPYRSQPNLRRSGGRSGGRSAFGILGLCLASGIALGAVALVSPLFTGFAQDFDTVKSVAPRREHAPHAGAKKPTLVETVTVAQLATDQADPEPQASPPPSPQLAVNQGQASRPPILRVKAQTAVRTRRTSTPPNYTVVTPTTPQEQWERQRLDYEHARHAYDASERVAGYRWAQQNKINVQRYCGAAEQRTAAFMEGCMNYVR